MTNLEAKTAIWITSSPRQEHIRTIQWLNEMSPDDISFYLLRLAAYRIADSDPAPLFSLVAGPSAEIKSFGSQKKELAERHVLRLRFWQQLLDRAKQRGVTTHAQRAPTKDGWISAGAGRSGISYNYLIWMKDDSAVELYIDTGDKDLNKRIFDSSLQQKKRLTRHLGKNYLGSVWTISGRLG